MEYLSRKQRRELKATRDKENEEITEKKAADEEIFKEQKKRLRRQLNSVSTFSLDSSDMKVSPNSLQTRNEVKKQKKIDEILRDIAVLPENEYLNEDTNLRLLKKMSVAKRYNRLQLSPEQEEKMAENKEKFETITNQLWFLIRELEKGKVPEPEIGTIPTIASEDVIKNRSIFDVEKAKTTEHKFSDTIISDSDFEMTNMNTKIDLLEEKLEKISLKNDELEGVLQDLEKVVQEGKSIVNDEVELQAYDIGEAPEDTLELLEYLEKLDELNKTKSLKLDETRKNLAEEQKTNELSATDVSGKTVPEKPIEETQKTEEQKTTNTEKVKENVKTINLEKADTQKTIVPQEKAKTVETSLKKEEVEKVEPEEKLEKKGDKLQVSIIILSVVFVVLLGIIAFMFFNLWQQGGLNF